jgi:hypothetical protein
VLQAIDSSGTRVLGRDASRHEVYRCPECSERVILKQGDVTIEHFAHQRLSDCVAGVGESMRHLQMKQQIGDHFSPNVDVQYEVRLTPEHRADVLLANAIVVECQASSIKTEEWRKRTDEYNLAGYAVWWVWDVSRFGKTDHDGESYIQFMQSDSDPVRAAESMRRAHREAYGRVYTLFADGVLAAVHLKGIDGTKTQAYRYVERVPHGATLRTKEGSSGLRIASFNQPQWWHRSWSVQLPRTQANRRVPTGGRFQPLPPSTLLRTVERLTTEPWQPPTSTKHEWITGVVRLVEPQRTATGQEWARFAVSNQWITAGPTEGAAAKSHVQHGHVLRTHCLITNRGEAYLLEVLTRAAVTA